MRIALYKGTDPMAWIVRLQTRSEYSHVALLFDDGSIAEATPRPFPRGSVSLADSIRAAHPDGITVDVFMVDAQYDATAAMKWLREQVGKRYDYRSVMRFVSRVPAEVNEAYFCSELAFQYFAEGGLRLLRGIQAHDVSPRDLSLSPYLDYEGTIYT